MGSTTRQRTLSKPDNRLQVDMGISRELADMLDHMKTAEGVSKQEAVRQGLQLLYDKRNSSI